MTEGGEPAPLLLLRWAARHLGAQGIATPRLDAEVLLADVLGVDRLSFLTNPHQAISTEQVARFEALVDRRASREPVAYLTGSREFWGLDLAVTPAVLIPRPDSETVVSAALEWAPRRDRLRVADLGAGSGCLLLALLSEWPHATGLGTDISAEALNVARGNADALGLGDRASWVHADWLPSERPPSSADRFDVIVANPPYVSWTDTAALVSDVRDHEPSLALFSDDDGLAAYRQISRRLPAWLAPGGIAVLELGQGQAGAVGGLMAAAGLRIRAVEPDLAQIDRALVCQRPEDIVGGDGENRWQRR